MFIRKLLCIIFLSVLIKISTSYHQYPLHDVNYHVHGYLDPTVRTCIRFLNYQQTIIKSDCYSDENKFNFEETSTDLSAGYQICITLDETPFPDKTLCTDNILWWDGWIGLKFCNDMHLHLKGTKLKLSWGYTTVDSTQNCIYP
ncbi:hypothetical protein F8M41_020694 [Gigaspora margarita]|uniref:Uncharacterized protein n=1 Tax=Gigaspora margarita TaxID=4874 RepID=A0A8H4EJK2_GIGMA|nr:hypothetical protein F8M41_020694 [Gigaspora margarita]